MRMDARRSLAPFTNVLVAAFHAVHVGRGAAEVTQISFEVGQKHHLAYFFENALLTSTNDKLTLVGTDGTESTPSKTPPVDVDGVFNHFIGGYAFVLVFRVWTACVRKVERSVKLGRRHGWIGWIDHDEAGFLFRSRKGCFTRNDRSWDFLEQTLSMHLIGFFLDVAEIFGLCFLVSQTFSMAVKNDVVRGDAMWNVV